jgi:hypothetical protein
LRIEDGKPQTAFPLPGDAVFSCACAGTAMRRGLPFSSKLTFKPAKQGREKKKVPGAWQFPDIGVRPGPGGRLSVSSLLRYAEGNVSQGAMRLALYRNVFLFYFARVADTDVSVFDRPQVFIKS